MDDRIERGRKSPTMVTWVVGVVALLGSLGFTFWLLNKPMEPIEQAAGEIYETDMEAPEYRRTYATQVEPGGMASPANTHARQTNGPVSEYREWVDVMPDGEASQTSAFAHEGLMNVTNALTSIAQRMDNVDRQEIQDRLQRVREQVAAAQQRNDRVNDRDQLFRTTVDVAEELDRKGQFGLQQEIAALRNTLEQEDMNEDSEHREEVRPFFSRFSEIIEQMDAELRAARNDLQETPR